MSPHNLILRDVRHPLSLVFLLLLIPHASALYVVRGSNCTAQCTTSPTGRTTNSTDVSCFDNYYNSTNTAISFENCLSCELESQAFEEENGQTDLGWAFFNMRYTLDECIFNEPNVTEPTPSPLCNTPCSALEPSVKTNLVTPNFSSTFDFCADPNFVYDAQSCAECYRTVPNQIYLSNFLNTLAVACESKPSPAFPFGIPASSIFTDNPPSNFSNVNDTASAAHHTGISSTKEAIAIAVPVAVFLLLSFGLVLFFVWRRTRLPPRRRRHRRHTVQLEKRVSHDTTPGPSPVIERRFQPSGQARHLRNVSDESRGPRTSPFPAPLKADKASLPLPLRGRSKTNSPLPYLSPPREEADLGEHPARLRHSATSGPERPHRGFQKRVEIPVPHTTPQASTPAESILEEETLPAKRYDPATEPAMTSLTKRPALQPPLSKLATAPASLLHQHQQQQQHEEPSQSPPKLPLPQRILKHKPTLPIHRHKPILEPRPPQDENRVPQPFHPLLHGTPFDNGAHAPSPPPPPPSSGGKLSWERIAHENARIRSEQPPIISNPVSPLTLPGAPAIRRENTTTPLSEVLQAGPGEQGGGLSLSRSASERSAESRPRTGGGVAGDDEGGAHGEEGEGEGKGKGVVRYVGDE